MIDWIVSVVIGILIAAVCLFLLPEGKMQPIIKTFLGVCVFFVMAMPVCKIFNTSFSLELGNLDGAYAVDTTYIEKCRREEIKIKFENIAKTIEQKHNVKCRFEFSYIFEEDFTLEVTHVYTYIENIHACEDVVLDDIKQSVLSYFDISKENIFMYGENK